MDSIGYLHPSLDFLLLQKKELDKLHGLRVPYSQINEKLESIHKYLKIPFNQDHSDRMITVNVQVSAEEVLAVLSDLREVIRNIRSYQLWVPNH